jgi:hypothetical protein
MSHSPEAVYDALAIMRLNTDLAQTTTRVTIQRIAYLACLLALYDGQPTSEWGYRFSRTAIGTPFSADVNDAIEALIQTGAIAVGDEVRGARELLLAGEGGPFLTMISGLERLKGRSKYLEAACNGGMVASPTTLGQGLDNEPTVRRALQRESGGTLLEGSALLLLHDQFKALSEVVGGLDDDLITPSVVWLSYMAGRSPTHRETGTSVDA